MKFWLIMFFMSPDGDRVEFDQHTQVANLDTCRILSDMIQNDVQESGETIRTLCVPEDRYENGFGFSPNTPLYYLEDY